jgi:hypothetical protein
VKEERKIKKEEKRNELRLKSQEKGLNKKEEKNEMQERKHGHVKEEE